MGNNCFDPIDLGDDADVIASGTTVDNDPGIAPPCGLNDTASEWFVWTAPSRVSFYSDSGTQYYIQVTGYNGAKGNFVLNIWQDCP